MFFGVCFDRAHGQEVLQPLKLACDYDVVGKGAEEPECSALTFSNVVPAVWLEDLISHTIQMVATWLDREGGRPEGVAP